MGRGKNVLFIIRYVARNFAISKHRKSRLLEIRVEIKVAVRLKQRDAGENSRAREKNKEATTVS